MFYRMELPVGVGHAVVKIKDYLYSTWIPINNLTRWIRNLGFLLKFASIQKLIIFHAIQTSNHESSFSLSFGFQLKKVSHYPCCNDFTRWFI